jgi:hypothetical protein
MPNSPPGAVGVGFGGRPINAKHHTGATLDFLESYALQSKCNSRATPAPRVAQPLTRPSSIFTRDDFRATVAQNARRPVCEVTSKCGVTAYRRFATKLRITVHTTAAE